MKVSVSLPEEDIAFLDDYAKKERSSRSAALHRAVRLLRSFGLGAAYEQAWQEWSAGGEAEIWDAAVGDGVES